MTDLTNPVPIWLDGLGKLADGAKIYVGVAGSDPEIAANQLALKFPGNVTATQPIRTLGGYTVNGSDRVSVTLPAGVTSYSIRVRDVSDALVFYLASANADGSAFQPVDTDLTAIAALNTTNFGRSVLTFSNAAMLDAATGRPPSLALAGGTMTGDIARQGAGDYLYWATAGMGSGRVFITVSTASDPTSQDGDVWITYDP